MSTLSAMRRLLSATALLVVLLSGCGDGDGDGAASTTSAGSATTTSTPATTAATSTTAPGVCPGVSVPDAATDLTTAAADFDGDGADDELRAYRFAGAWQLQVSLAAGGGDDIVAEPFGQGTLSPVGGFDVDEDGDDEAWVNVGVGGMSRLVGLFVFDDCTLAPAMLEGEAARFPVGGTFLSGNGVECAGPGSGDVDLTVFAGSSGDGTNYMVESSLLTLEGTTLTEVATDVFGAQAGTSAFTFDCGDLTL